MTYRDADSSMAEQLASELQAAVISGEYVDQELIELADNVLGAHQIYVQLLYVGMVVDRITQLAHYFEALDSIVEMVDTEDLAEASTGEKIRAISALNQAIKTKVEIISSMMASKDAVGMLTSSMKDTFSSESGLAPVGVPDSQADFFTKMQNLPPDQRQRVVAVTLNKLVDSMKGNDG
jgi:hypothetical protein